MIAAGTQWHRKCRNSVFCCKAKYQSDPAKYGGLIRSRDAAGIMKELTKPEVEVQVLKRVRLKASTYGRDPQQLEE